jgi:hypothetical protein
MMSKSVLSPREIEAVISGLREQGATVRLVAGSRHKVTSPDGRMVSLSLGSGDKQQILGCRTKLRTLGLKWPLDDEGEKVKPRVEPTGDSMSPEAVAAARERAERAEAALADMMVSRPTVTETPLGPIRVVEYDNVAVHTNTAAVSPSDEIAEEWIDLTPELAEKFLAHNTANRSVRERHVETLARDMEAGNWKVTGDSIKFDRNNTLLDGQHRLHAVIRSGVTIRVLLILGLDPSARAVIDTNARRMARDAVGFTGFPKYPGQAAAVARIALAVDLGLWRTALDQANPSFSNTEITDWVQASENLLEAIELGEATRRRIEITPAPWAYCLLRLREIDADAAEEFAYSLAEYRTAGVGDPRSAMLSYIRGSRGANRRTLRAPEVLYVVFRTWNAWRSGESLYRMQPAGGPRGTNVPVPR